MVTLNREWADCSLGLRAQLVGAPPMVGAYTATFMQSFTKYIQGGFQMNYSVSIFAFYPHSLYFSPWSVSASLATPDTTRSEAKLTTSFPLPIVPNNK